MITESHKHGMCECAERRNSKVTLGDTMILRDVFVNAVTGGEDEKIDDETLPEDRWVRQRCIAWQ